MAEGASSAPQPTSGDERRLGFKSFDDPTHATRAAVAASHCWSGSGHTRHSADGVFNAQRLPHGRLGGAAICEAAAAADDVHDALEEELTVGNRGWGWAAQVPEGLQGGAATAAAQALRLAMSLVVRKDPIETPIETPIDTLLTRY